MYIAFRWLVGLSVAMWIAMCILDPYKGRKQFSEGYEDSILIEFKNETEKRTYHPIAKAEIKLRRKSGYPVFIHYVISFVGFVIIYLAPTKTGITNISKKIKAKISFTSDRNYFTKNIDFKVGAMKTLAACAKVLPFLRNLRKLLRIPSVFHSLLIVRDNTDNKINIVLVKKFKEIIEEKRSLTQLLMTAMNENKSLKFQYQLETIAKNKLLRHLKDVEKQSSSMNFRHLYLWTRQENLFLKSSMKKVTRERDEAERNLITLINKVYCSNNSELKFFCSRLIVNTKNNLLNSNVSEEIMKFLIRNPRSHQSMMASTASSYTDTNDIHTNLVNKFIYTNTQSCAQTHGDSSQLPDHYTDLPTNYFWTVKDKDGIVEKLYEYSSSPNCESGEKIRNIREYAVYFDKDCAVDGSIPTIELEEDYTHTVSGKEYSAICNNKFLTGSDEFRKFMETTGPKTVLQNRKQDSDKTDSSYIIKSY